MASPGFSVSASHFSKVGIIAWNNDSCNITRFHKLPEMINFLIHVHDSTFLSEAYNILNLLHNCFLSIQTKNVCHVQSCWYLPKMPGLAKWVNSDLLSEF